MAMAITSTSRSRPPSTSPDIRASTSPYRSRGVRTFGRFSTTFDMAITIVQSAFATNELATLTATFGATPTNGNLMVVLAFTKTDAGMTGPSGWTIDKDVVNSTALDTARIASKVVSGDGVDVSITGLDPVAASLM